jgi:hypothetical protein
MNVFRTLPGNTFPASYVLQTTDLTALLAANAGNTLRLRFAEVDNVLFLNLGVDAVSLEATTGTTAVPEPGSVVLVGSFVSASVLRRLRRARRA